MRGIFSAIGNLVTIAIVVVVVLVALSFVGAPSASCADGVIPVSKAASDSFQTKWNTFDAAASKGTPVSVTFSEEEITSRGATYLAATGVPAKNLQVNLCPGQGGGQAALTMSALGLDVNIIATGHLDLATKPSRIAIDSMQIGMIPPVVGTLVANQVLDAANITVSNNIREIATSSTSATLKN